MLFWAVCVLTQPEPASAQSAGQAHARVLSAVEAPPGFDDACQRYAWLCHAAVGSLRPISDAELLALAGSINQRVNRAIAQLDDRRNYGVAEYWTLPDNGRGDCEDLALLKMKLLLERGVDARLLLMAVVLDHRGDNHAVLLLRLNSEDVMLDSLTDGIAPWSRSGYTFLAKQTSGDKARWGALLSMASR